MYRRLFAQTALSLPLSPSLRARTKRTKRGRDHRPGEDSDRGVAETDLYPVMDISWYPAFPEMSNCLV